MNKDPHKETSPNYKLYKINHPMRRPSINDVTIYFIDPATCSNNIYYQNLKVVHLMGAKIYNLIAIYKRANYSNESLMDGCPLLLQIKGPTLIIIEGRNIITNEIIA